MILLGRNKNDTPVPWGEIGPHKTTAFRGGGTLNFYGASAINKNGVMVVKGGRGCKKMLRLHRGVGTRQDEQTLSSSPRPPTPRPLFQDGLRGVLHRQQPQAAA